MNEKPDGGPAYPLVYLSKGTKIEDGVLHIEMKGDTGMTLRDYFAGQALRSMLTAPDKIKDSTYNIAAELSYKFADAMIAARDK